MGRREEPAWAMGTLGLTVARERGDITRQFQNRLTVTRSTIDRLGLEKELHGHMGCVNCLEWNYDGSILASASDDLHVILWDPYSYKQLNSIPTGHTGNIFSVKFVSPEVIATCAADGAVRTRNVTTGAALLECVCHCGRVKRLASAPHNPSLMWSAGEDGLVLQHDMRAAHRCNSESANVVVNLLNHMGRYAEAKCVAVNPRRPYQLAVGANDFYVRLYDIRMIKLGRLQSCVSPTSGWGAGAARGRQLWERQNVRCARAGIGDPDNNIPKHAACYYAPGHLSIETSQQVLPKKTTTYVAFSQDGNELLVNLGSEQVYIYDLNSARQPVLVESYIIQHNHGCREEDKTQKRPQVNIPGSNGTSTPNGTNGTVDQLPESARQLKEVANSLVGAGNYCGAVEVYNAAIARAPHAALLYSNRAAALMRRGWAGDTYAAIKDCYCAIKLDPLHVKSHFRLAKGLMDLKRAREAHECLLYFKDKFPKHANSHAVFLLQKDINLALEDMETEPDEVGGAGGGGAGGGGGGGAGGGAGGAPPTEGVEWGALSVLERQLRVAALDYKQRYLGHCNTTTDIKEANFLGPDASYLAAGSDDGSLFIWCRASGNIVRCLRGDESIVNCVQLHPSAFLLATSGIETAVRLWSPRPEDGRPEPRLVRDAAAAASANQQRMQSDPFEAMLLNISFTGERDLHPPACRPV